jgi:hypothetical protein
MKPYKRTADAIAQQQLRQIVSLPDLLCQEEFRTELDRLLREISIERAGELRAMKASEHAEIRQEFAAEAGFLIGFEIGRQLAERGAQ